MIHVIIAPDYDFFTKQKESLKKKLSLSNEYNVEEVSGCPLVHADFSVEGFFERPPYLLVYKYLFSEIRENQYEEYITDLAQTKHTVLLYEKTNSKEFTQFLKDHSITPVEVKTVVEKKEVTPFSFTDAVIARNKKDAWIEFMALRNKQVEMMSITSGLIWAMKSLLLVLTQKDVSNTGLNPYVYSKMSKKVSVWKVSEAQAFLRSLLYLSLEEQFDEEAQSIKLEQLLFQL